MLSKRDKSNYIYYKIIIFSNAIKVALRLQLHDDIKRRWADAKDKYNHG
jgi:hypothetical protein